MSYNQKEKEKKREYYIKNRDEILKKRKKYRENNREKVNLEKNRWYYKKQNQQIIKKWKKAGFKHTEEFFENLSVKYVETENCELCNIKIEGVKYGNNKKVTDHHHSSGCFRNICCHKCNMERSKIDNCHLRVMMELHRYFNR